MVVGVVAIILCCCIFLFLDRYRSAMVQSARTSSAQAVSQVSNTVGNYLQDMDQAMTLVKQSMLEHESDRDELLAAFLEFRPDVVAVTSYSAQEPCWTAGLPADSQRRTSTRISPLTWKRRSTLKLPT